MKIRLDNEDFVWRIVFPFYWYKGIREKSDKIGENSKNDKHFVRRNYLKIISLSNKFCLIRYAFIIKGLVELIIEMFGKCI